MDANRYVILVGIDFSELSDRALEQALALAAQRSNSEVHALTLVMPPVAVNTSYAMPAFGVLAAPDLLGSATEQLHLHVKRTLARFEAKYPEPQFPARVVSHVVMGTPAHGLAQMASDIAADLVVVGTHNRHGVQRLLLGSVAEGTVRYARCPVLVIPAEAPHDEVQITPPCTECVLARRESAGQQLWCAQHRERHGRRHTYHQSDRAGAETNFPLVVR